MKYWRHQATGSLCKGDHRPGEGWYLLPNFDNSSINPVDEVKAQQSTVGESTQPRMRVMNPELTLRDHFAGLAMQEIMTTGKRELSFHQVADYSYKQADAMLEVRERYATTPAYSLPDDVSKSGPGA